ncbi:MAG TPA: Asp-tRNA(Asn)/Glu-tRNA(Gln) amidotransferase subunit GatB [Victivallales bacterium]|nr:Asp-tRNA(Asn)/Glu-tRNA(Gln) amidotransferase subunit GatB [Victivallales bacterium]
MKYLATIGLEVHVQVKTVSKMFCSCKNSFGEDPNTLVCPVCMGLPGVMPSPNKTAIIKTIMAGLLTECQIANFSKFDRKSYFYPDMPKNYQISQYDLPFCKNGRIHVSGKGFSGEQLPEKTIGITRIHLEEDVGKLNHLGRSSGVDFNRAGVPLMEIVSEPDISSPDEAYAYLEALKEIMRYSGISDCDMEKGQMRCDVNVSVRPEGQKEFGTKIEVKNLNSFRAVHRSLEYEIPRQIEALINGEKLYQETRGWNDDKGESYLMRRKESAHDYRYFPEPDLQPFAIDDGMIEEIKKSLPELPVKKRERFIKDYGISEYDSEVLTQNKDIADYFDGAAKISSNPKSIANWIISDILKELNARKISVKECPVKMEYLAELVNSVNSGKITNTTGKDVLSEIFSTGKNPSQIISEKGLAQISDESGIAKFADEVIAEFPSQVNDFKSGKDKVLQFLIGQVMKKSKGKANAQIAAKILKEKLS